MQDPNYDEDIYEEKSKYVYKRRSSSSQQDLLREPSPYRTDAGERSPEQPFRSYASHRFSNRPQVGRRASWSELSRETDPIRDNVVESRRMPSYERIEITTDDPQDSDGAFEIRKVKKVWSYKRIHGGRHDQRERQGQGGRHDQWERQGQGGRDDHAGYVGQSSYGDRDDRSTKTSVIEGEDASNIDPERHVYCPVTRWDVDYTNRNYIRSKCHKPLGLHRTAPVAKKQYKWEIEGDNTDYLKSQVNAPKGLHRIAPEIKRKRVPDNDILADSTGWQFEYGPEFFQGEEDVEYMPEERVVGRGSYRYHGVDRNQSDTDLKDEERRQKIAGLIEGEFAYGQEFLQDDIPHKLDQKDGVVGRGGYRFYDVDRSHCDKNPDDLSVIDYRDSRTSMDAQMDEVKEVEAPKGKPFKRTILKKTLKATPRKSSEKFFGDERQKFGSHKKYVPGMGTSSAYLGAPMKDSAELDLSKHPSVQSLFKQINKTCSYSRLAPSEEGFHCEKKYSHKHFWDHARKGGQNYETSDSYDICDRCGGRETREYGASGHCEHCGLKESPEREAPERSYRREMPRQIKKSPERYASETPRKKMRTPAPRARSPSPNYTSDESCDLCERKEIPSMEKKISPGRFVCSSKDLRDQQTDRRSTMSYDSCDICGKEEPPRVATPKRMSESKKKRRSSTRDAYLPKKTSPVRITCSTKDYPDLQEQSPSCRKCELGYGDETYEKERKASAREYRSAQGDKFRTWKEREAQETSPLRMTGSISQRRPTRIPREAKTRDAYQRFYSPYSYQAEMMGDCFEPEEKLDEIPTDIESRMEEKHQRMPESCAPSKSEKVSPKLPTSSSSQMRPIKVEKQPKQKESFRRFQDESVYGGEITKEDQDISSDEFEPHTDSRIQMMKKIISRTSVIKKNNSKKNKDSVSRKHPTDAREEDKREDFVKNHREKDRRPRRLKQTGKIVEMIPSHSGSKIRTLEEKASPMNLPNLKQRESGKIVEKFPSHSGSGKIVEKFPSHSGSRVKTLEKKESPSKFPEVRRKSVKQYRKNDQDGFIDFAGIDFEKHKNHPKDQAKSFQDSYEKYVNENGNEIWIKSEEHSSELIHRP